MLPTNPQSLTAADRSVLESLKQQGEQIDRQSKVLETLVDRVTRQMRSDEKLEKSDQKQKNQFKGDTKVNAIPGMAFDKISDKFNDFIVSGFSSIKDKFKEEKSKPVDKSREPALKDKKPKEDTDVLKNILNNMVTTSKYQEQMLEHTKALQSIADKTYVSINELNNNLQTPENIEQPTENTVTTDNNTEKTKVEKKEKNTLKLLSNNEKSKLPASNDNIFGAANETAFTDKKLPDEIGVAVGKSLKPNLDNLGKTLKDALAQGFGNLELAVNDIDTASLPIPPVAGAVGGGAALLGSTALAAGVVTGGALLASGASNALSNATDEQLDMLSADIGSDTGIAAAAMLESRQPKLKPKEEQASIRKIDNQIANAESERNAADKKTGGRYTEGRLERRADKIKPEYLKFAQKFYNDPNLQDPDYLSLPENKGILELLEERQKLNMNPEIEKVKPKKGESTSLMKSVTDENRELTSKGSTQGAPIIVNNTTNAVSESGSSANFASATPRNQSTAVNDYLRGNGKLHDAVYR
jgi:hypothetical protein